MTPQHAYTLPQRARDDQDKTHCGFALVIALSLMALIVLLVISITTLMQVETRSAQINLNTLKARESARIALALAIGQLQEHAGHDQRITARAEILGDEAFESDARFWTGVWDATDMDKAPVWLVSGTEPDPGDKPATDSMQLVGPGTVGDDGSQHVRVPTVEVLNARGAVSSRLGWWISDEGVKASIASLPLHERPTPNFLEADDSLQLQLAATHGLEAIFSEYNRFSATGATMLDRISSIGQLNTLDSFQKSAPDTSREALFHTLTLNSHGVLAGTTDKGGLMQDLSLFPALLGTGLQNYLQLGETHANQLAAKEHPLAKKLLFTDIVGLEDIGDLSDGDIATPILPVLSNFMIAFTIRTKTEAAENENFLLRARFFCEFWNPFTHTLSMIDNNGDPIYLELEITGFPKVIVYGDDNSISSNPIDLQEVMKDPGNDNDAVVIRLLNGENEPWFPGRTKNWVGLQAINGLPHSPYESIDTETKKWFENNKALGGIEGIDTGVSGFSGKIRHESSDQTTLQIKVYKVTVSSRNLISNLDGFLYEPVSTVNPENRESYLNKHKDMTFGYHVMLQEPYHSNDENEFYRGYWLKDSDPRNPKPSFLNDWHLKIDTKANIGSPYTAVFNGKSALSIPEPQKIYQSGNNTINFVNFERLLDRSKDQNISLDDLWQDAPLFELPRRRILSLASLQHIYMHNERPFQVGNSWGNEGRHNTSEWFDHYYFSGLSRNDTVADFDPRAGPSNPCLRFFNKDTFVTGFESWKSDLPDNPTAARKPAQRFMAASRFNINSTSVDAWKAVLSSLRIDNFEHLNWSKENTTDLNTLGLSQASRNEGSFTRFSHSLEETYQATASPVNSNAAPSAFYRHGARRFDSEQFETFAREIVHLIKEKGRPFKSMEEFLSELPTGQGSLLEQAIRKAFADPVTKRQQWRHSWETTGQHKDGEAPIEIDHFSPGFLTQADVMTAIGPMLAPRSDTFKIRARGDCFDDFGEPIGSATIEAVLQRTPEATDPSKPLSEPTDRKWKITSIRWLTDDAL